MPTSGGGGRGRNRRKGGRAEEDEYELHEVSIEEIIAATLDLRKRRYSLLSASRSDDVPLDLEKTRIRGRPHSAALASKAMTVPR